MIRIGLLGSKGRMGTQVQRLLAAEYADRATLACAVDADEAPEALLGCDVVIDFSSPRGMAALTRAALGSSATLPAFAVGSTGWDADGLRALENLAKRAPVLLSSNFSLGVLALTELLRSAAPILSRLGYAPVIVEHHHRHKKDAPSGTALTLSRAIAPDDPSRVQIHAVRAGEVIGDHEVSFYGTSDVITLSHHAQDRSLFARGALEAALWLGRKRSTLTERRTLISMSDFFHNP
ncbi:MAG: 4-hydroxy-tetrahydrodipicolinate reductase [Oligoflexia bacterium]|nr:4-hydroxy-tetrahydrodipicolinate reductase [Oligoflexia bacterium]